MLEKRKIDGIIKNPLSYQAYINNLKKVLEVLRFKKVLLLIKKLLPLEYASCENEICNGNATVIRKLLIQLRDIYSKQTNYLIQLNE